MVEIRELLPCLILGLAGLLFMEAISIFRGDAPLKNRYRGLVEEINELLPDEEKESRKRLANAIYADLIITWEGICQTEKFRILTIFKFSKLTKDLFTNELKGTSITLHMVDPPDETDQGTQQEAPPIFIPPSRQGSSGMEYRQTVSTKPNPTGLSDLTKFFSTRNRSSGSRNGRISAFLKPGPSRGSYFNERVERQMKSDSGEPLTGWHAIHIVSAQVSPKVKLLSEAISIKSDCKKNKPEGPPSNCGMVAKSSTLDAKRKKIYTYSDSPIYQNPRSL